MSMKNDPPKNESPESKEIPWIHGHPSLEDFTYEPYIEPDDDPIPDGVRSFWKQIQDIFVDELHYTMDNLANNLLKELYSMDCESRAIFEQSTVAHHDALWTFEDLVEYFKLPERTIRNLMTSPYSSFPKPVLLEFESDSNNDKTERWFPHEIIRYTKAFGYPPPLGRTLNQPGKKCSNCGKCRCLKKPNSD